MAFEFFGKSFDDFVGYLDIFFNSFTIFTLYAFFLLNTLFMRSYKLYHFLIVLLGPILFGGVIEFLTKLVVIDEYHTNFYPNCSQFYIGCVYGIPIEIPIRNFLIQYSIFYFVKMLIGVKNKRVGIVVKRGGGDDNEEEEIGESSLEEGGRGGRGRGFSSKLRQSMGDILVHSCIAGIMSLILDISMEHLMSKERGYWVWDARKLRRDGDLFMIPIGNYLEWTMSSFYFVFFQNVIVNYTNYGGIIKQLLFPFVVWILTTVSYIVTSVGTAMLFLLIELVVSWDKKIFGRVFDFAKLETNLRSGGKIVRNLFWYLFVCQSIFCILVLFYQKFVKKRRRSFSDLSFFDIMIFMTLLSIYIHCYVLFLVLQFWTHKEAVWVLTNLTIGILLIVIPLRESVGKSEKRD